MKKWRKKNGDNCFKTLALCPVFTAITYVIHDITFREFEPTSIDILGGSTEPPKLLTEGRIHQYVYISPRLFRSVFRGRGVPDSPHPKTWILNTRAPMSVCQERISLCPDCTVYYVLLDPSGSNRLIDRMVFPLSILYCTVYYILCTPRPRRIW